MAITDYLQGINNATSGEKADVNTASNDLSELQIGEGSLPAKLKDALNTKLNNNADIINQQADTMQNYFNSGAEARAKYQDVWNPFEKAKLVQQERSMALRPYDVLSGVLENRMGQVSDIVDSGVQGWQGMVNAATTRLGTAKDMLSTALSSYLSAAEQQQAADDMAFKIAQAEEAARQFEKTYGLESRKLDIGESQFAQELALKKATARNSGGGSDIYGTGSTSEIDAYAVEYNKNPGIIGDIPSKYRGQVLARAQELKNIKPDTTTTPTSSNNGAVSQLINYFKMPIQDRTKYLADKTGWSVMKQINDDYNKLVIK